jgi:hydroxymethylbilane synthase
MVIGTRGSRLAIWQAEHVAGRLQETSPGMRVQIERIRTTGDKILDAPLAQVGGKALFVKEIEEALLAGRVDLAVHSMKDVPTELPAGLMIGAISRREDPADVLISRTGARLSDLPRGARVGTSSLRRQAQLLHHRPDLVIVGVRGNLDTRIRKLHSEGLDAIVLAAAGVKRLGLDHLVTELLVPEVMLPAIGQGALGIEIRDQGSGIGDRGPEERPEARAATSASRPQSPLPSPQSRKMSRAQSVAELVNVLDDRDTHIAVRAERAMLRRLGGGCQVPIAALATVTGHAISLDGLMASTDGSRLVRGTGRGAATDAEAIGRALAEDLLGRGGQAILEAIAGGEICG